jgi:hypothetical protein
VVKKWQGRFRAVRLAEQRASKLQGGQAGSNLANRAQQGRTTGFLDKANASDWRKNRSPQWNQAVKNNRNYWNKWSANNQGKLADFRANRDTAWNNNKNFWTNRNPSNTFKKPEWNNYKNQVNQFRKNRGIEINNNIQKKFNNNFDNCWWGNCGWRSGPVVGSNPWCWWGAATAATAATAGTFLAIDAFANAAYTPPVYDYGVNVVYQGDEVYVDGQPTATTKQLAQQAIALANQPAAQPPPPMPPETGQ